MSQPYTPQQAPPPPAPVKKKGFPKWAIIAVIVVILAIAAAAAGGNKKPGTTAGNTPVATNAAVLAPDAPTDTPVVAPTAVPAALAPAYTEIASKKESMTDAQWDEYAKTLKGLRIENWEGPVLDVDNKILSDNYWVSVDLDGKGGAMNVAEAKVEVTKEDALKISKGQTLVFSGEIDNVNCVLTYCPVEVIRATWSVK